MHDGPTQQGFTPSLCGTGTACADIPDARPTRVLEAPGCAEVGPALPTGRAQEAKSTAPASQNPGALRVLVVDDSSDAALSTALLLRLWGHAADTALDGPAALRLAAERTHRVVLLDLAMPG